MRWNLLGILPKFCAKKYAGINYDTSCNMTLPKICRAVESNGWMDIMDIPTLIYESSSG